MWQKGLVGASEGNISCRLNDSHYLCTPSGLSKGHLKPDDLVIVDISGIPTDNKKPSSELGLHLQMYSARKDCQAVIHAHPPYATAFAVSGKSIPDDVMPEAAMVLGSVASVPFGLTGTPALALAISPYLEDHKSFLLENHGAVVIGSSLNDAYNRIETLERIAQVISIADSLGGANPMPQEIFNQLLTTSLNGRLD